MASEMPSLPDEVVRDLDGPIIAEDFTEALKLLKQGKAPSLDGYTLAYYKIFVDKLAPRFLAAFNSIQDGQMMPTET